LSLGGETRGQAEHKGGQKGRGAAHGI
jgi:hypothetical protein